MRAGIVAVSLLVGVLGSAVQAITITEFSIPTTNASLRGIAAGSDGNIWFTEYLGNKIGRMTPSGVITEFPLAANRYPRGITAGPDGNLWFGETSAIGRITVTGIITEFALPNPGDFAEFITVGPDRNLWFTEITQENSTEIAQVGRITPSGVISWFSSSCKFDLLGGIAAGPDGNLWLTESSTKIGRVNPANGSVTEFCLCLSPEPLQGLGGITTGPDANMWVNGSVVGDVNQIVRITTTGAITQFQIPSVPEFVHSGASGITLGPDGNVWFTESMYGGKVERITATGAITEFPIPKNNSVDSPMPGAITAGPDNTLWFTISGSNNVGELPMIGRIYVGPPRLTVIKKLMPAGDAGRFNLLIDGVIEQPTNVGDGGTSGPWVLVAGPHTVGESGGTKADGTPTDLRLYRTEFGGDCALDGSITLTDGDEKTCTIANTYAPPDFSLSASPAVITPTVRAGQCGGSTVITVNPINGFTGIVELSPPNFIEVNFSPNPTSTTSTLSIPLTPCDGFPKRITITGASGGLSHTLTIGTNAPTCGGIGQPRCR